MCKCRIKRDPSDRFRNSRIPLQDKEKNHHRSLVKIHKYAGHRSLPNSNTREAATMSRNPGNLRLRAMHECTGRQTQNLINNRTTRYVGSNTRRGITQAARNESRQQCKHKQRQPANH
eukprot:scaffold11422_cov43-Attheya_sp.AAC.1